MTTPPDRSPLWVIMPVLAAPDLTLAAIADVLAQSIPTRLLIVNQGVDDAFRLTLERVAEEHSDRVLVWSHHPSLPSLAATWNRALRFVWEAGGEEALVINNDVRLHARTAKVLNLYLQDESALFVTAVGVTAEQFNPDEASGIPSQPDGSRLTTKGGPDFSCFLISHAGHEKYPFDEAFIPAFCEDLDTHRRYLLGGDGDKIFSINLPYLHVGGGSNTLKTMAPPERAAHERRIGQSRAYYEKKWGGEGVNHERYTIPFEPQSDQDGVTTPELQRAIQEAAHVPAD
jgi:hypothetical protein